MSSPLLKNPFFWLRSIILVILSFSIFYYISDITSNFFQNRRLVNINDVTSMTVKYLWEKVYSENFSILLLITLLILILIIHVIIIYQDKFGEDHGQ